MPGRSRYTPAILVALNLAAALAGLQHLFWAGPGNLWALTIPVALVANAVSASSFRSGAAGTCYLVFSVPALLAMPVSLYRISNARWAQCYQSVHPLFPALLYTGFFGLFVLGCLQAVVRLSAPRLAAIRPPLLRLLPGLLLAGGGVLAASQLTRTALLLDMYISPYSLVFGLLFFSAAALFIKFNGGRPSRWNCLAGLGGIMLLGLYSLPLLLTPVAVLQAEADFARAFSRWQASGELFPYSLAAYFLGLPAPECQINEHVLYHQRDDLLLHYDAFLPPAHQRRPGGNPTIIRIHGGGWVTGNKGRANRLQLSKYLANQGYVVFDIQYGLARARFSRSAGPDYLTGDFTIDDMVEHIGIFIAYLEQRAEDYGADLETVFFFGSSAGGHLATVAGLAAASGKYSHLFGRKLNVRGIIAMYPAYDLAPLLGIGGSPEFVSPSKLAANQGPPILIFQGTHDAMVPAEVVKRFRDHYSQQGNTCIFMLFPLAGHAADRHFGGNFNQTFIHYLLNFLHHATGDGSLSHP